MNEGYLQYEIQLRIEAAEEELKAAKKELRNLEVANKRRSYQFEGKSYDNRFVVQYRRGNQSDWYTLYGSFPTIKTALKHYETSIMAGKYDLRVKDLDPSQRCVVVWSCTALARGTRPYE